MTLDFLTLGITKSCDELKKEVEEAGKTWETSFYVNMMPVDDDANYVEPELFVDSAPLQCNYTSTRDAKGEEFSSWFFTIPKTITDKATDLTIGNDTTPDAVKREEDLKKELGITKPYSGIALQIALDI